MNLKDKIENRLADFLSKYWILGMIICCLCGLVVGVIIGALWVVEQIFKLMDWSIRKIFKLFRFIFVRPIFVLKNKLLRIKIIRKIFRSIYSGGKLVLNSIYFEKFFYFLLLSIFFIIANIISRYLLSNYANEWWLRVIFSVLLINYFKKEKDED